MFPFLQVSPRGQNRCVTYKWQKKRFNEEETVIDVERGNEDNQNSVQSDTQLENEEGIDRESDEINRTKEKIKTWEWIGKRKWELWGR